MTAPNKLANTSTASELPDDVAVEVIPAGRGSDGFAVHLDIEGQVSELHPDDAAAIGAALVAAAEEAERRSVE